MARLTLTAAEARTRSQRTLTPEELSDRYEVALREIADQADLREYSVNLTVAEELAQEFDSYFEEQGYRVLALAHGDEDAKRASPQIRSTTSVERVLVWQTYEFTETMATGAAGTSPVKVYANDDPATRILYVKNPTRRFATVDIRITSGFRINQQFYYRLRGTLTAADYQDGVTEGVIAIDELGEGSVLIQVKSTALNTNGKTAVVDISWDSNFEGILYSSPSIIVSEADPNL